MSNDLPILIISHYLEELTYNINRRLEVEMLQNFQEQTHRL
jgi:hypothetical protein